MQKCIALVVDRLFVILGKANELAMKLSGIVGTVYKLGVTANATNAFKSRLVSF